MGPGEIREFCPVDDAGHSLLRAAMRQLNMSERAYHRTLKLAERSPTWPARSGSRRRTWRRRCSTGRGGRCKRFGEGTG